MARALLIALAAATLAACDYSSFEDCAVACTTATGCPAGYTCGDEGLCRVSGSSGTCAAQACRPGTMQECYSGAAGTKGVGPCVGGSKFCDDSGHWGPCTGEVVPVAEACADQLDNNCNGMVDEDDDADGDGFSTCAGDCCDSTECAHPELVNPGAFEVLSNNVDDDCNPTTTDTAAPICDQGLASSSTTGLDYAKAMDLCQTTTMAAKTWGVIDAKFSLTSGTGTPDKEGYAIRPKFGAGVLPQAGTRLVLLSTGGAAAPGDTNPAFHAFDGYDHTVGVTSTYPSDWYMANDSKLPHSAACPAPTALNPFDPVMLTLKLRVPTNAHSFSVATNLFAADFPEYVCYGNADAFLVLLDSAFTGTPANPVDKNLAVIKTPTGTALQPVDVDLAFADDDAFLQCQNGATGCKTGATPGSIATCSSTAMLEDTGFDTVSANNCAATSMLGGATGWMVTRGNVVPGEVITLRFAIWDTGDHDLDSLVVLDNFRWSTDPAPTVGTSLP